jgi:hypothetical protein
MAGVLNSSVLLDFIITDPAAERDTLMAHTVKLVPLGGVNIVTGVPAVTEMPGRFTTKDGVSIFPR